MPTPHRPLALVATLALLSVATTAQSPQDAAPLFGFGVTSSAAQRQREAAFDAAVQAGKSSK